jgi:hypothetical protein
VSVYFTADVDTLGTTSSTDDTEALMRITVPSGVPNQTPDAVCQSVTVPAGPSCDAEADVNDLSSDPDDDPFALDQSPLGPYPVGVTNVTLTVTDIRGDTDSCTGSVTVTVGDAPVALSVAAGELSWDPAACSPGYDVVRGDLASLRASSGDFSAATSECLGDDHATTSLTYSGSPGPGEAFWYLVRRVVTGGNGTYDSGAPSQVASRDLGIASSGQDCP